MKEMPKMQKESSTIKIWAVSRLQSNGPSAVDDMIPRLPDLLLAVIPRCNATTAVELVILLAIALAEESLALVPDLLPMMIVIVDMEDVVIVIETLEADQDHLEEIETTDTITDVVQEMIVMTGIMVDIKVEEEEVAMIDTVHPVVKLLPLVITIPEEMTAVIAAVIKKEIIADQDLLQKIEEIEIIPMIGKREVLLQLQTKMNQDA